MGPLAGVGQDIRYAFKLGWAEMAYNMIYLGPLPLGLAEMYNMPLNCAGPRGLTT